MLDKLPVMKHYAYVIIEPFVVYNSNYLSIVKLLISLDLIEKHGKELSVYENSIAVDNLSVELKSSNFIALCYEYELGSRCRLPRIHYDESDE